MLTDCPRCVFEDVVSYSTANFCVLCGVRGQRTTGRKVALEIGAAYRIGNLEAVWDMRIGDDLRERLTKMIREVNCLTPPPENTGLTKAELFDDYLQRAAKTGARVLRSRS